MTKSKLLWVIRRPKVFQFCILLTLAIIQIIRKPVPTHHGHVCAMVNYKIYDICQKYLREGKKRDKLKDLQQK